MEGCFKKMYPVTDDLQKKASESKDEENKPLLDAEKASVQVKHN
jgi:hypothetical protein